MADINFGDALPASFSPVKRYTPLVRIDGSNTNLTKKTGNFGYTPLVAGSEIQMTAEAVIGTSASVIADDTSVGQPLTLYLKLAVVTPNITVTFGFGILVTTSQVDQVYAVGFDGTNFIYSPFSPTTFTSWDSVSFSLSSSNIQKGNLTFGTGDTMVLTFPGGNLGTLVRRSGGSLVTTGFTAAVATGVYNLNSFRVTITRFSSLVGITADPVVLTTPYGPVSSDFRLSPTSRYILTPITLFAASPAPSFTLTGDSNPADPDPTTIHGGTYHSPRPDLSLVNVSPIATLNVVFHG
jgi:hypothetical protein